MMARGGRPRNGSSIHRWHFASIDCSDVFLGVNADGKLVKEFLCCLIADNHCDGRRKAASDFIARCRPAFLYGRADGIVCSRPDLAHLVNVGLAQAAEPDAELMNAVNRAFNLPT